MKQAHNSCDGIDALPKGLDAAHDCLDGSTSQILIFGRVGIRKRCEGGLNKEADSCFLWRTGAPQQDKVDLYGSAKSDFNTRKTKNTSRNSNYVVD
jgi:hypothetical protein